MSFLLRSKIVKEQNEQKAPKKAPPKKKTKEETSEATEPKPKRTRRTKKTAEK